MEVCNARMGGSDFRSPSLPMQCREGVAVRCRLQGAVTNPAQATIPTGVNNQPSKCPPLDNFFPGCWSLFQWQHRQACATLDCIEGVGCNQIDCSRCMSKILTLC